MNLPQLDKDKGNHYVYGSAIFVIGYLLGLQTGIHPVLSGVALVLIVAVGREAYSRVTGKGTYDPLDAVATVAGAIPAAIVALVPVAG